MNAYFTFSLLFCQTRVYDEAEGMWHNMTKNYTVYGNFTRTIKETATITGLTQPTDSAISPNGKFVYVITGYFSNTNTVSGFSTCLATTNKCPTAKGYLTVFTRDPHDGSLLFLSSSRYTFFLMASLVKFFYRRLRTVS
jgi:hypothetical protein